MLLLYNMGEAPTSQCERMRPEPELRRATCYAGGVTHSPTLGMCRLTTSIPAPGQRPSWPARQDGFVRTAVRRRMRSEHARRAAPSARLMSRYGVGALRLGR